MTAPTDFTTPVELACVRNADTTMARAIPLIIFQLVFIWLVVAVTVGLFAPETTAISATAATVVSVGYVGRTWIAKYRRLKHTYGDLQRLRLSPAGLYRTDGTASIAIAWTDITGFEYRNSALPARRAIQPNTMSVAYNAAAEISNTVMTWGIVGHGTTTPLPGARRRLLKIHDRLYGSQLRNGKPHDSDRCLIFPAEFEHHWTTGTVGSWLRHYRPDLALPATPN